MGCVSVGLFLLIVGTAQINIIIGIKVNWTKVMVSSLNGTHHSSLNALTALQTGEEQHERHLEIVQGMECKY